MSTLCFSSSPKALKAIVVMLLIAPAVLVSAGNNLLFIEMQGVAAYNINDQEVVWYSHHPHDAMQKPAVGFDFISRLRTRTKDWGYVALQARLAYNDDQEHYLEPQLYNAYLNIKARAYDVWAGHNKPALGLSSYLDNHALLLSDATMGRLNFDRDWGAGISLERHRYDIKLSFTTGSGMPLHLQDSYLLAGRVGFGDLAKDNRTLGLSLAYGEVLMSMGYEIMHNKMTHGLRLAGADFSYRYLNWEMKSDVLVGEYNTAAAYSVLLRLSHYLLPEDRLTAELQHISQETGGNAGQNYSIALSYRLTPYFTVRTLYDLHTPGEHQKLVFQLYYYKGLVL